MVAAGSLRARQGSMGTSSPLLSHRATLEFRGLPVLTLTDFNVDDRGRLHLL